MDISKTIAEMKLKPGFAENVGMVLVHNGTVRQLSRGDKKQVKALEVIPNQEKIEEIRQKFLQRPGIFDVIIEARMGTFLPGEDLLFLIVAGDIRENVKPALADLLDQVKSGPIAKKEIMA